MVVMAFLFVADRRAAPRPASFGAAVRKGRGERRNVPSDVAAGLGAFYDERLVQMRHAVAELADPETAAWLVGVIVDGIGLREAAGFQLPPDAELHAALRAVFLGRAADHA